MPCVCVCAKRVSARGQQTTPPCASKKQQARPFSPRGRTDDEEEEDGGDPAGEEAAAETLGEHGVAEVSGGALEFEGLGRGNGGGVVGGCGCVC